MRRSPLLKKRGFT